MTLLLCLPLAAYIALAFLVWPSVAALLDAWVPNGWRSRSVIASLLWFALRDLGMPLYPGLAIALVPLHRWLLLGERRWLPFRLGRRELAYFGHLIEMSAIAITLVVVVPAAMQWLGFGIADYFRLGGAPGSVREAFAVAHRLIYGMSALLILYVVCRLSLSLPALAVAAPRAIPRGWRAGAGNGWRLAAVLALVALPVLLPMMVLNHYTSGPHVVLEVVPTPEGELHITNKFVLTPEGKLRPFHADQAALEGPSAALRTTVFCMNATFSALLALLWAATLSLGYRMLGPVDSAAEGLDGA